MSRLNLRREKLSSKEDLIMQDYKEWREFGKISKMGHYILPNGFEKYLPLIHTGAINLYLFYCLHSRNDTGESWYSIETLSHKLDISTKSISNWNKELEELGLIYRKKDGRGSAMTFLLPITDFMIEIQDGSIENYLERYHESNSKLLGKINIFQWNDNPKEKNILKQVAVLCYCREYETNGKVIQIRKFAFRTSNLNKKLELAPDDFKENVYLINKETEEIDEGVLNRAVALHPKYKLKGEEFLQICQELFENVDILDREHFGVTKILS